MIEKDKIHLIRDIIDDVSCGLSMQYDDLTLTLTVGHEHTGMPSVHICLEDGSRVIIETCAYGKTLEGAYLSALTELCVCALGEYAGRVT